MSYTKWALALKCDTNRDRLDKYNDMIGYSIASYCAQNNPNGFIKPYRSLR
jgi:hypothetical protein